MRPGPRLARFTASRRGATAVEFALIAPCLLLIVMACVDLPRAIATGRRLSLAAGSMADLISRGDTTDLADVYAAAQAIATPYNVANASIVLTAAGVYPVGTGFVGRVCSSAAQNDQPRAAGSVIGPAPPGTGALGARYVMAEVKMRYAAVFTVFPVLNGWVFTYTTVWPVREGKAVNGRAEVVLPGGHPCPLL